MTQTLYASFDDPSLAEKAAGALLDYGVLQQDLSLVTNEACLRERQATFADSEASGFRMPADWQAAAAGRAPSPAGYTPFQESGGYGAATATDTAQIVDRDEMDEAEDLSVNTYCEQEITAKSGISTTTPADAGAGAAKGAGIGLGLGVLAGLASLFVPGAGLVFGGGALAGALAAAAATTAAGAVAGGVTGYLKDQGMTEELAARYHGTVQRGGAILALALPSGNVAEPTAMLIVTKYGAADVHVH